MDIEDNGGGAPDWRREAISWRNRFILLLDHLPLPLALCDPHGEIRVANPAMAAECGLLPGQLRGRNALDFFVPSTKARLHPIAEAVRRHRRSRYPVEVTWCPPSGVERHGEMDVTPVSDAPDLPPSLLLMLRVAGERAEPRPEPTSPASETEARILALAAGGGTTARIAKAVGLTADGVNYHLAQLSRRWGVRGRTALVARAYTLGVLDPGAWPPVAAQSR
ncbi:PAS domain-containing protein [Saccharopolyspora sp. NPDC000359]|uniref:PAS domain-containing protein n=1 Tax=Saccharopolyspora sp. NPDC000359 TaxID=3154251 RepID=UPI003330B9D4